MALQGEPHWKSWLRVPKSGWQKASQTGRMTRLLGQVENCFETRKPPWMAGWFVSVCSQR
jgi:hypothetical protein